VKVCALIAARNEEVAIVSTIDSIISAGIPKEDVYLVSDGSTDATVELAQSRQINVLALPVNGGKSLAIAKGIKHFKLDSYDLLALADADTTFEPGYFTAMVRAFEANPNAAIACGKVKSRRKNWLTAWRALQYAVGHWLIKEGQYALRTINVAAGCCSVFRMSLFDQIWESKPSIVEDMMATLRAHYLGYDVIYVRDAVVITADPQDLLRSYTRQLIRWNGGAWTWDDATGRMIPRVARSPVDPNGEFTVRIYQPEAKKLDEAWISGAEAEEPVAQASADHAGQQVVPARIAAHRQRYIGCHQQ